MRLAEKIFETLNTLGSIPKTNLKIIKPKSEEQEMYQPPKGAVAAAKKAIEWKEKYPSEVTAGTQVGWTRAGQLARGEKVSFDIVKRMHSFFSRHDGNQAIKPEHKDTPWKDNGYIAWLIWGGDSAKSWAEGIVKASKNETITNDESLQDMTDDEIKKLFPFRYEEIIKRLRGKVETPTATQPTKPGPEHERLMISVLSKPLSGPKEIKKGVFHYQSRELDVLVDTNKKVVTIKKIPTNDKLFLMSSADRLKYKLK
jgi:hypothetical protein